MGSRLLPPSEGKIDGGIRHAGKRRILKSNWAH
jgi:hypothetical protein